MLTKNPPLPRFAKFNDVSHKADLQALGSRNLVYASTSSSEAILMPKCLVKNVIALIRILVEDSFANLIQKDGVRNLKLSGAGIFISALFMG